MKLTILKASCADFNTQDCAGTVPDDEVTPVAAMVPGLPKLNPRDGQGAKTDQSEIRIIDGNGGEVWKA